MSAISRASDFFKGIKKGMSLFGECLSTIVNSVLLLVVYLFGVGLTALFARISGKHFLDSTLSKKQKSYWTDLNLKKDKMDKYYRQF